VLFEHPAVVDAVVFATPHATLGEEVAAVVCVLPGSDVTPEVLREHAARHLATHKVPAHVWIAEEPLPRGDTGKVLKRVIQDTYAPLVPTT
jgi:long-chain acyl-CoA synthetase